MYVTDFAKYLIRYGEVRFTDYEYSISSELFANKKKIRRPLKAFSNQTSLKLKTIFFVDNSCNRIRVKVQSLDQLSAPYSDIINPSLDFIEIEYF